MSAVGAAVQSNRMTRGGSSLKRSSGDAFNSGRSSNGNLVMATMPADLHSRDSTTTTNNETVFSTHITSPPPLMFSPNSTSIRLATGSQTPQQNVDIIGGLFRRNKFLLGPIQGN